MSIACPYCKAALNPKRLKPGRFQPKCPGCARAFLLLISVQPLEAESPKPAPPQKLTDDERASLILDGKTPADFEDAPAESEVAAADPNSTAVHEPKLPDCSPRGQAARVIPERRGRSSARGANRSCSGPTRGWKLRGKRGSARIFRKWRRKHSSRRASIN